MARAELQLVRMVLALLENSGICTGSVYLLRGVLQQSGLAEA